MLQTVQIKQREAKTLMIKRIQYLERIFMDLIDKNLCTSFPSFYIFKLILFYIYYHHFNDRPG